MPPRRWPQLKEVLSFFCTHERVRPLSSPPLTHISHSKEWTSGGGGEVADRLTELDWSEESGWVGIIIELYHQFTISYYTIRRAHYIIATATTYLVHYPLINSNVPSWVLRIKAIHEPRNDYDFYLYLCRPGRLLKLTDWLYLFPAIQHRISRTAAEAK